MHTERVTYLTNAEQKAALEAFAKARGESVGSVLREAASRYMNQPSEESQAHQAELDALTAELEEAVPHMKAAIDAMVADVAAARKAVAEALSGSSNPK